MKCPTCGSSTDVADGYCDLCGSPLPGLEPKPEDVARARRSLAEAETEPRRGAASAAGVMVADTGASEGERLAETAFLLAVVSLVFAGIAAPIAFVLARRAKRKLAEEGRESWMASAAEVIGAIVSLLVALAIAILVYWAFVIMPRALNELHEEGERIRQLQQSPSLPAVPPAP